MATSFLPYSEPDIVIILIQSSLLIFLNVTNAIFDKIIYCGLLAQVFIGVAWGTPGAKWLSPNSEFVIVQLGYLGLILLVYEGGLNTNFRALKANLFLSVLVAITGISLPIALSFVLQSLLNATPLQAFAAGAALCSTSLGTTFTILSSSGLAATRLGVVLSSAAMMDDVVGLVMVQVISNLGSAGDGFEVSSVVRPLGVSVGLAVGVPSVCAFVVKPVAGLIHRIRETSPDGVVSKVCGETYTAFFVHTLVLLGLVAGASYAGTSNLFAAYLAGASISWFDSEVGDSRAAVSGSSSSLVQKSETVAGKQPVERNGEGSTPGSKDETVLKVPRKTTDTSGTAIYERYYATAVQRILKPFFFASIGFAIPITEMFKGKIFWRGLVYTILMLLAKLLTGVWLIRMNLSWPKIRLPNSVQFATPAACLYGKSKRDVNTNTSGLANASNHEMQSQKKEKSGAKDIIADAAVGDSSTAVRPQTPRPAVSVPKIKRPLSLYPAAMLGIAMTARGEIGFLIASLAETTGLFASSSKPSNGSSEIYLVVTWAIVLCTIIGPLGVGTLVKRVRRLQGGGGSNMGVEGPLGIWGVGQRKP